MGKMIFNKEETKNLYNMLRSSDAENHIIAFNTLKNVDIDEYLGELIVLYKYSGLDLESWKEAGQKIVKMLQTMVGTEPVSSPKTLSILTKFKGSKTSIELFMEFFTRDMIRVLEQVGYPTECFDINIKLKDDGQTTES